MVLHVTVIFLKVKLLCIWHHWKSFLDCKRMVFISCCYLENFELSKFQIWKYIYVRTMSSMAHGFENWPIIFWVSGPTGPLSSLTIWSSGIIYNCTLGQRKKQKHIILLVFFKNPWFFKIVFYPKLCMHNRLWMSQIARTRYHYTETFSEVGISA